MKDIPANWLDGTRFMLWSHSENRFYRLLLHLKIPKPDIQCEIRFEITEDPME